MGATVSRQALLVKALALVQLVVGFAGSIIVARLAIARIGLDGFGDFAFLLGFAAILALSDLGMVPGLTAEVGARLRAGERAVAYHLAVVGSAITVACWAVLATASVLYVALALPGSAGHLILPLVIFAASAALVGVADVAATPLRVDGDLAFAYLARLFYQVLWIGGVVLLYALLPRWEDVTILTVLQLAASAGYSLAIGIRLGLRGALHGRPRWSLMDSVRSSTFRRAWEISAPERGTRLMGAVLALGERSLLLVMGSTILLGSYDLLLRVCALISAVPSALAQPLLSMLSSNRSQADDASPYGDVAGFVMRIGGALTTIGLVAAFVIWIFFAEALFGVRPDLPMVLALAVFVATAINVQTAPGVAVSVSEGDVDAVKRKVWIEATGVLVAVVVASMAGSALWFIGVRYVAVGLAASVFLIEFRRGRLRGRHAA